MGRRRRTGAGETRKAFGVVTLKFYHGGYFKFVGTGEMVYQGGGYTTKQLDPDHLCYFDLLEMGKEVGGGKVVEGLYYLIPEQSMSNGIRRILNDGDVVELGGYADKFRTVEVYLFHGVESPELDPTETVEQPTHSQALEKENELNPTSHTAKVEKLIPKRAPHKLLMTPVRTSPRKHTPNKVKESSCHLSRTEHALDISQRQKKQNPSTSAQVIVTPTSLTQPQPHIPTTNINNTTDNPTSVSTSSHAAIEENLTPSISLNPKIPFPSTENIVDPVDTFDWFDNRPESPIPLTDLLRGYTDESDESDPLYNPETDKGKGEVYTDVETDEDDVNVSEQGDVGVVNEDLELELLDIQLEEQEHEAILNEELQFDSETSDDEYDTARERVKVCNNKLLQLAQQLQREASEGKLGSQDQEGCTDQTQAATGGVNEQDTDYEDSEDDIHTPPESDQEGEHGVRKSRTGLLVSPNTDFSQFIWKVGLRFANRENFKEAVTKYAVLQGRNLRFRESNNSRQQRLGVKCVDGCPFYVYGSWHNRKATFLVKTVCNQHTCHRNMKKNRQLKCTWVAKQFLDVFKSRPHWPAKEIIECIRRAYKQLVKKDFAYKVKYAAHKLLHGSMSDHYMKVGAYMEALRRSSPGSHLVLVTDTSKTDMPVFRRLFVCYEGLKKGWLEGCRKVLCVDACFLKTFLGGQLFCAVGRDSNDQMYPLAWAVAEGENNDSWLWFFEQLQQCLDLGDGDDCAIISDEHQAILNGVATVLPNAEHRHCARHIFANWHKAFRGDEMKLQFWKIAKSYNEADYKEELEKLRELNPDAAEAFKGYNPQCFCRAFLDPKFKTDAITSNMVETFNGYIISARTKHLLFMLEDIRSNLMQRLVKKRKEMEKSTSVLCPRIQAKLEKEKHKASYCEVMPSSEHLFNVSHELDQLVVNLESRTCTCRKWEMLGIPCCHAVACLFFLNKDAEDFVEDCYKTESYLKAYAGSIPPLEGERHWPKVHYPLEPPPIKIGPGRPRRNRIKDPFENPKKPGKLTKSGVEMTCSLCQTKGHNKRRCPNRDTVVPLQPPAKKARGRPRKDTQIVDLVADAANHSVTVQPTQLGRGNRAIRGGVGSRGGSTSTSTRGRGRGQSSQGRGRGQSSQGRGRGQSSQGRGKGRGQSSQGRGRGSTITSVPTARGRGKTVSLSQLQGLGTQSSQTSTLHQPTQ